MEFTDSDTSSQENDHSEKGKVGSNSKRRSTSNLVMMKTESNSFLNQSSVNANLNSAHSVDTQEDSFILDKTIKIIDDI